MKRPIFPSSQHVASHLYNLQKSKINEQNLLKWSLLKKNPYKSPKIRIFEKIRTSGNTGYVVTGYKSHIRVHSWFCIVFVPTFLASLPLGVMLRMHRGTVTNLEIVLSISKKTYQKSSPSESELIES